MSEYKLVPFDPTPAMLDKGAMEIAMNYQRGQTAESAAHAVYRAMIAAAPVIEQEPPYEIPEADEATFRSARSFKEVFPDLAAPVAQQELAGNTCQYAEDVGMPEHRCAVVCQYAVAAQELTDAEIDHVTSATVGDGEDVFWSIVFGLNHDSDEIRRIMVREIVRTILAATPQRSER